LHLQQGTPAPPATPDKLLQAREATEYKIDEQGNKGGKQSIT
jgi:hypothetical protein